MWQCSLPSQTICDPWSLSSQPICVCSPAPLRRFTLGAFLRFKQLCALHDVNFLSRACFVGDALLQNPHRAAVTFFANNFRAPGPAFANNLRVFDCSSSTLHVGGLQGAGLCEGWSLLLSHLTCQAPQQYWPVFGAMPFCGRPICPMLLVPLSTISRLGTTMLLIVSCAQSVSCAEVRRGLPVCMSSSFSVGMFAQFQSCARIHRMLLVCMSGCFGLADH